jgi:hypothetical protein
VNVRFEGVRDRQAVVTGQIQIDLDIAAWVDHNRLASRPVADQVRQVSQANGANRLEYNWVGELRRGGPGCRGQETILQQQAAQAGGSALHEQTAGTHDLSSS